MSTKSIPQTIVKAKNGATKFLEKLEEISLEVTYGKKTFNSDALATYQNDDPSARKKYLMMLPFLKIPVLDL